MRKVDGFVNPAIRIACASRGRAKNAPVIEKLFPGCIWYIRPEDEASYRESGAINIVVRPETLHGLGKIRQWILDQDDNDVFIVDDDVKYVWCNVGLRGRRIEDPDSILRVILNARDCAKDIGTCFFGFAQAWDVRKYTPNEPFNLSGWFGSAIGFVGRDIPYDQGYQLRNDVAYSLKVMLEKRIIWRDNRFAFVCERFKNLGGLAHVRTQALDMQEVHRLTDEWGKYVAFREGKEKLHISVDVPRRQNVIA